MTALAEDPTAAAVLAEAPCYPVPPDGRSPAIEAVREARAGSCLAIGRDGVCLILRRAWLALDLPVTPPIPAYLPYGSIGVRRADLRCGLIPAELLRQVLEHFRAALPNEAAAFILWDEANRRFWVDFPQIDRATPSHLTYRPPALPPHHHLICDIHSHGHGAAFSYRPRARDREDLKFIRKLRTFRTGESPCPRLSVPLRRQRPSAASAARRWLRPLPSRIMATIASC